VKELLATGDVGAASTEAIQALGPTVLGYLRPALHDEDDVADAFAQWAENMWKGLPAFEWRSSLSTWAIRIACNVTLNLRDRPQARRERRFHPGEASAVAEAVRTTTAARVERQRRALDELRKELTVEQQTLLFLRLEQELSWDEIADVLSTAGVRLDANTACKRFERVKSQLERLAREKKLLE